MSNNLYMLLNQLPPGTQNPDDNFPVDFKDPFEVIVFVILPMLIIIGYILWKRKRKKPND
ncbi:MULTISPECIES: adenylosuccinate synthetase [Leeuwenhoekiella]|uniref:adenylosuccinate synthetase n=1 Tax=Leeuwenhoekiella TaxID=283735 RepID=UPI0025C13F9F|nr:adenylosuccinate synthetase [Leeuwenhoekiella sp. UBA6783]